MKSNPNSVSYRNCFAGSTAFLAGPPLANKKLHRTTHVLRASYLSPTAFNVNFDIISKNGNFGAVFFGQYADPASQDAITEVVVKCPVESSLGRQLYSMEKHTNVKLQRNCDDKNRFPKYVGELILPPDIPAVSGIARLGLVWRRAGSGDTLEQYLSASRVVELASLLGTVALASPLRRELSAAVLLELALMVHDLQSCGIVHRDIKPENLLVVPGDPAGAPLKAIDFGSSCDWSTPFKKGLRLATCDPVYAAPEKRLDFFKPAFRFDVYSIGLIALRCAAPSLTDASAMSNFVTNNLAACRFSLARTCSAILSRRVAAPQSVVNDIKALTSPAFEDMYALLATMLTESPEERAEVRDCLNSRFLRFAARSDYLNVKKKTIAQPLQRA